MEERSSRKTSVQSMCKKIGDYVRQVQTLAGSAATEEALFEKSLGSLQKTSRRLRDGLLKLPDCSESLKTGADKLNASVFLFVENARKARMDLASNRGAMDRAAFDVHSSLSVIKKESAAVASALSETELQLSVSSGKVQQLSASASKVQQLPATSTTGKVGFVLMHFFFFFSFFSDFSLAATAVAFESRKHNIFWQEGGACWWCCVG
jgi:uncharacterized phage infection (PIP) family protein YhgE